MSEIYIPPNGLYFRLLGYASQRVLFSRSHAEPQVWHHPVDSEYEDQYFTLIHGTGSRKGLYAIKSKRTGKVLFSRTLQDPNVWHVDGDGKYNDNWFELEPGKGQYAKTFRLLCPATNTVIFSRVGVDPEVYNYPGPPNSIYADQHFSFRFEDMQIDKIEYDLKVGRIISSTPEILANQTLTNGSDREQEMKFELNRSETHTSTFEYGIGFTISVGATAKGGVPFIAEGELRIDTSVTNEWKFGEANSFTKTYTASFPVKAGPHETVRAVSTVNRGELEVPYTIHLRSKSTGFKVETKGKWHGVSTWDLRHTIEKVEQK
ncbi:hemolytic lectin [Amylostereum chailletii]|nr:hemolytic lectin [Amylostereum chailletii]